LTNENRRKNIALMIDRGDQALHAADVLVGVGDLADAVSRAYYGAFYYARALLLTEGIEPRRHGSVDRLVQRDFVRTGKLDPDIGGDLSRLQAARQNADYTAEHVFTEKATRRSVEMARRFAEAVRSYLDAEGWLEG
jgi:uncharacterized protein (UPF0332 family)